MNFELICINLIDLYWKCLKMWELIAARQLIITSYNSRIKKCACVDRIYRKSVPSRQHNGCSTNLLPTGNTTTQWERGADRGIQTHNIYYCWKVYLLINNNFVISTIISMNNFKFHLHIQQQDNDSSNLF